MKNRLWFGSIACALFLGACNGNDVEPAAAPIRSGISIPSSAPKAEPEAPRNDTPHRAQEPSTPANVARVTEIPNYYCGLNDGVLNEEAVGLLNVISDGSNHDHQIAALDRLSTLLQMGCFSAPLNGLVEDCLDRVSNRQDLGPGVRAKVIADIQFVDVQNTQDWPTVMTINTLWAFQQALGDRDSKIQGAASDALMYRGRQWLFFSSGSTLKKSVLDQNRAVYFSSLIPGMLKLVESPDQHFSSGAAENVAELICENDAIFDEKTISDESRTVVVCESRSIQRMLARRTGLMTECAQRKLERFLAAHADMYCSGT